MVQPIESCCCYTRGVHYFENKMLNILPQSTILRLQNRHSNNVIEDSGSYLISLQKLSHDVVLVTRNRNVIVSSVETSSVGTLFHTSIAELSIQAADFVLLECRCYSSCSDEFQLFRFPLLAVSLKEGNTEKSLGNTPNDTHSIQLCCKRNDVLHSASISMDNAVLNIRLIPIVDESNHVLFILIVVILSTQLRLYSVAVEIKNEELVLSEDILLICTIETKASVCIETASVVNSRELIQGKGRKESVFDNMWKVVILSSDGKTFTFQAIDVQHQSDQLTATLVHEWILSDPLDGEEGHWEKVTFDYSGIYVAAAHSNMPYVYVWNIIDRVVTHRFLLQLQSSGESKAQCVVVSSICFNLESSLLACSTQSDVLIFSLDSSYSKAATWASNTNTEFNCMATFDFLGIPIPAFNLNLDFFLWGSPADTSSNTVPPNAVSKADTAPTVCIARITNLGENELLCKFLRETDDKNMLQILDVVGELCYEYEVLDSGRCFRRSKRKLDFSIPDSQPLPQANNFAFDLLIINKQDHSVEDHSSSTPQALSLNGFDDDSEAEIDPLNYIHMDNGAIPSEGDSLNRDFDVVADFKRGQDSPPNSVEENDNNFSIILQDSNTVTFINRSIDVQDDMEPHESLHMIPSEDNNKYPFDDSEPNLIYEPITESISQYRFVNSSSFAEGAIVLDCGSGNCKVGLAGSALPYACFPSLIGRPKYADVMEDSYLGNSTVTNTEVHEWRDCYVGNEAQQLRGVLALQHPVLHGEISDWESIELLWRYAFYDQLNLKEDNAFPSVLLTESPLAPAKHREQCVQIMFESLHVQALCLKVQAALSLFSLGRSTGCVLESGDGVTQSVPILEGYTVTSAVRTVDLAGCDVTAQLTKLLRQKGYSLYKTSAEFELVRDIKERWAFVKTTEEAEGTASSIDEEESYELPDGQIIRLKDERFLCTEILFQPHIIGKEIPGIHGCLYQSINACDVDIREEMFSTIVFAGGNSLLAGFGQRMRRELTALTGRNGKFNIIQPDDRLNAAWIGGSVMASLSTFPELCMSRSEYDECGPSLVHSKCL